MKNRKKPWWLWLLFAFLGAVLGGMAWSMLVPVLPSTMLQVISIGSTAAPWTMDLHFLRLTFGAVLQVNLGAIVGLIISLVVCYCL